MQHQQSAATASLKELEVKEKWWADQGGGVSEDRMDKKCQEAEGWENRRAQWSL